MNAIRRRFAGVRGADPERGSIVVAMLLMLVATSVGALILPVFLNQTKATAFDTRRVQQLAAAQSGVEVAIARIRAAGDATGGLIAALPCAPIVGNVLNRVGQRYQATVQYYKVDPQKLTASQLTDPANLVPCVVGAGTPVTPGFALITSKGSDTGSGDLATVAGRTVRATYVVQTTNANIAGGLFRVYRTSTSTDLCLDAGSVAPIAGGAVTLQACNGALAQQKWAYDTNLLVYLVGSRTTATPLGMCLDGLDRQTAERAGNVIRVQPCAAVTVPQQQWSLNDQAEMQGTNDGVTLNTLCWTVQATNTPGSQIVLSTTCGSGYNTTYTWQPEAAVGAGASGAVNGELVNYAEFGRCLDVTNYNVDSSYLIAWPCKQSPDPTKVGWNQKWTLPALGGAAGPVTATNGGTRYCLVSPLSADAGRYVTVTACPAGATPANMTWTAYGATATYATGYRIMDSTGRYCLAPTDPAAGPADFAAEGNRISKIVVAPCNSSTLQKWNAPPNLDAPTVKDQNEG